MEQSWRECLKREEISASRIFEEGFNYYGLFILAIFATILTLITFTFLWKIEKLVRRFSDESI